ncbi:hypothetical protein ACHAC9_01355 [Massilia sp. CMS3.1]|uniref:hypothetical protein n=1 Tax=Massilia sp. CMS3.1 TaxID=3373083 RepID=UPI003EE5C659
MEKLIAQLVRLYMATGQPNPGLLAQRVLGEDTAPVDLSTPEGTTRAIVIPFDKARYQEDGQHWARLCEVAHALQARYGFPAPGVSISAVSGFRLWLSLEAPVPADLARQFLELLREAAFPDLVVAPDAATRLAELPPCRDGASGRWAAFIHPGMGASFIDEPGLEMAPPPVAQAAFLEQLESIELEQFHAAIAALQPVRPAAAVTLTAVQPGSAPQADTSELLLRNATLEDIVRHLHAQNIEPTFRHLVNRAGGG